MTRYKVVVAVYDLDRRKTLKHPAIPDWWMDVWGANDMVQAVAWALYMAQASDPFKDLRENEILRESYTRMAKIHLSEYEEEE